ncbi:outer membrane protein assembly factor BamC [Chitinibacter tainanensis]|uniref:outer membrane protein assembly factor BamC n=1 Tax=Chitinibacter tainanensis TaxID=230667 RepID=UPI000A04AA3F|nr:outer membrane protein assembly factor BamC [Chitinibacter tainanensis]
MQIKTLSKLLLSTALLTTLSACATGDLLSSKVDYRKGSDNLNRNQLEIPPNLTSPSSSTYSTWSDHFQRPSPTDKSLSILPDNINARLKNIDGVRYIEINSSPESVWHKIYEFWISNGFQIQVEKPEIGIMETDWLENNATLPANFLGGIFKNLTEQLLSTGSKDRFRTRIEKSETPNVVNVYITHQGVQQQLKAGELGMGDSWRGTIWTQTPANTELEIEMMTQLVQALGTPAETAKTQAEEALISSKPKANLNGNELVLDDQADRAWRRAGLAFDRIGYNVLDRNRSTGVYSVQRAATDIGKESETSYFSSLAFWKKADADNSKNTSQVFDVQLKPAGDKTVLTITSKDPIDPAVQKKMLNDLLNQLK